MTTDTTDTTDTTQIPGPDVPDAARVEPPRTDFVGSVPMSELALPHSTDMEQAVVGAVMLRDRTIDQSPIIHVASYLKPAYFYDRKLGTIYETALSLFESGQQVDISTVIAELKRHNRLNEVGGYSMIKQLVDLTVEPSSIETYAASVFRDAQFRRWDRAGSDTRRVIRMGLELEEAQNRIEQIYIDSMLDSHHDDLTSAGKAASEQVERLKEYRASPQRTLGFPSGLRELDRYLQGFQRETMTLVAGRPGSGKSDCAITLVLNLSALEIVDEKTGELRQLHVLWISIEMGRYQLANRLLSRLALLDNQKLKSPTRLEDEDVRALDDAAVALTQRKITICDAATMHINTIRTLYQKINATDPVDVIVVDYLQLADGLHPEKGRTYEVGSVSRGLTKLAKHEKVAVIALAQLSREVEKRRDKRPMLSDLRETGQLEQDAHNIIFLHREELYDDTTEKTGLLSVEVAKNRDGGLGSFDLRYDGSRSDVRDLSDNAPSGQGPGPTYRVIPGSSVPMPKPHVPANWSKAEEEGVWDAEPGTHRDGTTPDGRKAWEIKGQPGFSDFGLDLGEE